MTPAQRLQALQKTYAFADAAGWEDIDEFADALYPLLSGELVIVPAEPTEGMLKAGNDISAWETSVMYHAMIKQYQKGGE